MRRTRDRRSSLFLAAGLATCALPAVAQQPESVQSPSALKRLSMEQLMDIEVMSVSRHPERLSQTASAIQVITQEDIHRSAATSLPEALRLATNLEVAQIDSRQWAISARGFAAATANKLLVLIDGRTIYTPLFSGVFWDVQDTPLSDIERIEVISGPGATLWGANAVNGVINIITKNARDTHGFLLSGGAGSMLQGFGTARYGGALRSNFHYRAYVKAFGRDATELPNGQGASDNWHLGQGGFRLDWDPSEPNRLTLQGDLYDGRISQPNAPEIDVNGANLTGGWSHTFSANADMRVQVYYDRTHRNIPGTFTEDLDTYDVDVQQHSRLGPHNDVVWGLGYRRMEDRVGNSPALAFLPANVGRQWFSGFVQNEIALVRDRLHLTLGAKIEHNDYTGVEFQPSGRLNWTVGPKSTLWGAISRAVRTPSRIDRELFAPGQPPFFLAGGPSFQSEELLAYELGYRLHTREVLSLSLATFYNRYDGIRSLEQVNPPAASPLVIGNGQEGETYGAELRADYRVSAGWRLSAGYTELRVRIRPTPASTDTSRGSAEAHDPERQFSVRSSLDLLAHFKVAAALRYSGEIANQQVPDYAELETRLTWEPTPKLALSIVGQNLLHRRHAESGSPAARREIERSVYGMVECRF